MKHPMEQMLRSLRIGLLLVPFGALPLSAQDTPEETPTEPTFDTDALLYGMGFVMAAQIDLRMGLSEGDIDLFLQGIRDQANGLPRPENYNQLVLAVRDLYTTRRNAWRQEANTENMAIGKAALAKLKAEKQLTETPSGLLYEIMEAGNTERTPQVGDSINITLSSTHIDGRIHETSNSSRLVIREKPDALAGLMEGLQLIGEGGRIKLYVPGNLLFGERPPVGTSVQPGEALIFDITLTSVTRAPEPQTSPAGRPNGPFMPKDIPNFTPPSGPPPGPPPQLPAHLRPPTVPPANLPPPPANP